MNIDLVGKIDGEEVELNEELKGTFLSIFNSYIKQKISGVKVKEKKEKKEKKTRNGSIHQPHLTSEEKQNIVARGSELQHLTAGGAAEVIRQEIGRPYSSMYVILTNAQKEGRLSFKKSDKSSIMENMRQAKKEKQENPQEEESPQTSMKSIFQRK